MRTSQVPRQTVDLTVAIRREHPAWSKHKVTVILKRDHGIKLSSSTAGRILKHKGLHDGRVSRKHSKAAKWRQKRLGGRVVDE